MRKFKKLLTLVLVVALALSLLTVASAYGSTGTVDDYDRAIVFVHTNDVHGAVNVEPYVAAVAADLREEYGAENVIVASAGDVWGGATIASLSNGEYIAPIMNAAGYDVMVLGNHDVARGVEQALKVAAMNTFPTLSATWTDAATGQRLMDAYTVFNCGDVKVGVFGLTTPDGQTDPSHPTSFLDYPETTKSCIDQLKAQDCDVIVALTHLGYGEDYTFDSTALADTYGELDLIIDGHSHTELPEGHVGTGGALIAQTGENGNNIGVSKIYIKNGAVVGADTQLITAEEYTAQYTPDAATLAVVEEYTAIIDAETSKIVGKTDVELVGARDVVRVRESNLGDVITDAIRSQTGADIALFPGALIRSSLAVGELSLDDYLNVFGSGADTYVVESTGAQLRQLLGFAMNAYPEQFFAFPQISGARITLETGESNRVAALTWEDGTPIGDEETFTLALDFLFINSTKIYSTTGLSPVTSGQSDMAQVLIAYMGSEAYTVPSGTGRITVTEAETPAPEAPVAPSTPAEGTYYVVVAGDSLWTIAQRQYGTGTRWGDIYEANRDQIRNASLIYVGQRLVIPQ